MIPAHTCGIYGVCFLVTSVDPPLTPLRTAVCGCHRAFASVSGFLEIGETGEEGAAREAREEMNADIDVGGLLAVYGLPHIGQM